jgi:hypothetical protein
MLSVLRLHLKRKEEKKQKNTHGRCVWLISESDLTVKHICAVCSHYTHVAKTDT